jgi:hypothetical protein
MEWKAGDIAISIFTLYENVPDKKTGQIITRKIVDEGKRIKVQEVIEGPCQPLLFIGLRNFDDNIARCICSRCSPRHEVWAQPYGDEKVFLLSHWFIKPNDEIRMIEYKLDKLKNPNKKREEFLRYSPIKHDEEQPLTKPKETEKIPTFQK